MKTKKGMTLIEIVISLGIYALLALLLTEIMSVVNSTMRATNQLNNRLSFQSNIADNQLTAQAARGESGDPESRSFALDMFYGDVDPATGDLISETHIGEDGSETLTFNEWTVMAPVDEEGNPREVFGVNYVQDINYKFMTYEYPTEDLHNVEDFGFLVEVFLVPYIDDEGTMTASQKRNAIITAKDFIDQVDSVVIEGELIDEEQDNHDTPHYRPIGEPYVFTGFRDALSGAREEDKNSVRESYANIPDGAINRGVVADASVIDRLTIDTSNPVFFQILNRAKNADDLDAIGAPDEISNFDESGTRRLTVHYLDSSGRDVLSFDLPELYMYVRRGSTKSFYERAAVALDLNMAINGDSTRALRVGRSHVGTEDYDLADFLDVAEEEAPAPEETPEEPDDEG